MKKKDIDKADIKQLDYQPQKSYLLDLEIFSAFDFRHKGSKEKRRSSHKYMCYMLVCITSGSCNQLLDCEVIPCETGTIVIIKPGQTHSFGDDENWEGWIIMFRPEYIQSVIADIFEASIHNSLGSLPKYLQLNETELCSVVDTLMQIIKDTRIDGQLQDINMLVRFQLYGLLSRLLIYNVAKVAKNGVSTQSLRCFEQFRQLLENNYACYHQVSEYANKLGYTEKSLTRATREATGMSAKSLIATRINLEAKRLLVHTDLSITRISEKLGFEEVTNFIKYFKRINLITPIAFRKEHGIYK